MQFCADLRLSGCAGWPPPRWAIACRLHRGLACAHRNFAHAPRAGRAGAGDSGLAPAASDPELGSGGPLPRPVGEARRPPAGPSPGQPERLLPTPPETSHRHCTTQQPPEMTAAERTRTHCGDLKRHCVPVARHGTAVCCSLHDYAWSGASSNEAHQRRLKWSMADESAVPHCTKHGTCYAQEGMLVHILRRNP